MGQTALGKEQSKEVSHKLNDLIPELKDVTLTGVVTLGNELGRGAYGTVFTIKYKGIDCAAKRSIQF